jgi:hypothetical protein
LLADIHCRTKAAAANESRTPFADATRTFGVMFPTARATKFRASGHALLTALGFPNTLKQQPLT